MNKIKHVEYIFKTLHREEDKDKGEQKEIILIKTRIVPDEEVARKYYDYLESCKVTRNSN